MLYNVPTRTVTNMSMETTIRLSEIDNIIGIKEASGNLDAISKIIAGSRPGFRVWSGDDPMTLPILSIGGYGVVSVASHLVGNQIGEMIQRFRTRRKRGRSGLAPKSASAGERPLRDHEPDPAQIRAGTGRISHRHVPTTACGDRSCVCRDRRR